ncbi:MAG TPA: amidase [Geminicoccus sp.]|uniref:amidase n=1 Tax=Geminicoccus sp. TaxID=2024832 RepID=UPI002E355BFC|nr:amidase [Geminicoccus sp.]HEX2529148.1 amidase [Geminicoccus sp.]
MSMPRDPLEDAGSICRMSAAELAAGYEAGQLSPVEVARAVLARAEEIQPSLNAFTRIDHDGALKAAEASQARWRAKKPLSPVDGVPTTIKDIVWMKDQAMRYGTVAVPPVEAGEDAPAVKRLREAGCVFIGITTTPEFGWKALTDSPGFGITRNPHRPDVTPGGSSGGAAVAAAVGAGVFHLGTDGGGSIRIPSSFTGIVGLKPSFGRVAAYPASPFGTVAHIGPMTRSVADTKAMLAVMAGRDERDWYQQPGVFPSLNAAPEKVAGLRIGYWSKPAFGAVDPEIEARIGRVVQALEAAGAEVEPFDLPAQDLHAVFQILWFAGAAARREMVPEEGRGALDPGFRDIAEAGSRLTAADFIKASGTRAAFGTAMDAALERYDVLISPGVAIAPFTAGQEVPEGSGMRRWTEWAGFSYPINLSQQPGAAIPCGKTADGRPIGLQIVGARGADGRVLEIAQAIEDLGITRN